MSYRPGSEVELARAQQRVFMAGNGATAIGQVPASGGDPLEGVDSISEFNFGEARCGGHVDARSGKKDEYACMIVQGDGRVAGGIVGAVCEDPKVPATQPTAAKWRGRSCDAGSWVATPGERASLLPCSTASVVRTLSFGADDGVCTDSAATDGRARALVATSTAPADHGDAVLAVMRGHAMQSQLLLGPGGQCHPALAKRAAAASRRIFGRQVTRSDGTFIFRYLFMTARDVTDEPCAAMMCESLISESKRALGDTIAAFAWAELAAEEGNHLEAHRWLGCHDAHLQRWCGVTAELAAHEERALQQWEESRLKEQNMEPVPDCEPDWLLEAAEELRKSRLPSLFTFGHCPPTPPPVAPALVAPAHFKFTFAVPAAPAFSPSEYTAMPWCGAPLPTSLPPPPQLWLAPAVLPESTSGMQRQRSTRQEGRRLNWVPVLPYSEAGVAMVDFDYRLAYYASQEDPLFFHSGRRAVHAAAARRARERSALYELADATPRARPLALRAAARLGKLGPERSRAGLLVAASREIAVAMSRWAVQRRRRAEDRHAAAGDSGGVRESDATPTPSRRSASVADGDSGSVGGKSAAPGRFETEAIADGVISLARHRTRPELREPRERARQRAAALAAGECAAAGKNLAGISAALDKIAQLDNLLLLEGISSQSQRSMGQRRRARPRYRRRQRTAVDAGNDTDEAMVGYDTDDAGDAM